ncbi:MAG: ribonuclease P protein component [Candidatus Andersenbacteria bacterium]
MLAKQYRLRRARDIARAKRGRILKNADFGLRVSPTSARLPAASAHSRATVVVAKSVAKRAVDRNRIKRQVRALLAQPLQRLQPARDLVLTVKAPALGKSYTALGRALTALLRQL